MVAGQSNDEDGFLEGCDEFIVTSTGLLLSARTGDPVPIPAELHISAKFEMKDNYQVDQLKPNKESFIPSSGTVAVANAEEVASLMNVSL